MRKTRTSVVDALGRAHTALLEDLRELEAIVHPAPGIGLLELRAALARPMRT